VLTWIGALAVIPAAAFALFEGFFRQNRDTVAGALAAGLGAAIVVVLHRGWRWEPLVAIGWGFAAGLQPGKGWRHVWSVLGATGLTAWGVQRNDPPRIDLGIVAFAFAVAGVFFSSLWDRLNRSAALIALGALFLGGGWALEVYRRRLIAEAEKGQAS
jgi:hypothetical protein